MLSGPSGGVAGALYVARKAGFDDILTFDMGGTSTDVALCQNGEPTIGRETSISHFRIKVPSVNVHTVGAGGGSIAHVPELTRALRVGPQSAGADPGPACVRQGRPGADRDRRERRPRPPAAAAAGRRDGARRRRRARRGADDRRRDGARLARGGRRGHPRDRQREHGGRAAARLGAARPRPARVRARRLRRRGAAARERRRGDHGLVPGARPAGARPAVRDRRPRRGLPRRVRADVHPRARGGRPGRGRHDPRRSSAGARPSGWTARASRPSAQRISYVADMRYHGQGYEIPVAIDPDEVAGRPRRPRGALQRAARAALRLPHARHGVRDRQPARDRLRRRAEARAAGRRAGRRGRVRRRRRGARDRLRGRARADEDLRPREARAGRPRSRAGDRHGVRLDHGGAARLRGRGRHELQHPHQPEGRERGAMATITEELADRRDPDRRRDRSGHARHHRGRAQERPLRDGRRALPLGDEPGHPRAARRVPDDHRPARPHGRGPVRRLHQRDDGGRGTAASTRAT